MAAWQVPIELIPAKWAEKQKYRAELLYGEDGFDTTCAWKNNQPSEDLERIFGNILPKAGSWSEDLTVWGNEETHDINVWYEDTGIFSVGFRLDLRENVTSLMSALVDAALELNWVFFVPGQKVIFKPNMFELKKYILKSNAAKFVQDPEAFLKGLSGEP